ncbi:hypothetical protein VKT23_001228 [Stygiomarasmius scandens]|uniref:Uncharacterized protein n=1 Tax=Marasmiellus scandens TaxID=2682957 RepID=A0ABR1K7G8_9AGAR
MGKAPAVPARMFQHETTPSLSPSTFPARSYERTTSNEIASILFDTSESSISADLPSSISRFNSRVTSRIRFLRLPSDIQKVMAVNIPVLEKWPNVVSSWLYSSLPGYVGYWG